MFVFPYIKSSIVFFLGYVLYLMACGSFLAGKEKVKRTLVFLQYFNELANVEVEFEFVLLVLYSISSQPKCKRAIEYNVFIEWQESQEGRNVEFNVPSLLLVVACTETENWRRDAR